MLFIDVEDFFNKVGALPPLNRDEEKSLAQRMASGDENARKALIESRLPLAASYVRRLPKEMQTLKAVYSLIEAVEKGVDSFNFLQESETFNHHLSWRLRQCITRLIAER